LPIIGRLLNMGQRWQKLNKKKRNHLNQEEKLQELMLPCKENNVPSSQLLQAAKSILQSTVNSLESEKEVFFLKLLKFKTTVELGEQTRRIRCWIPVFVVQTILHSSTSMEDWWFLVSREKERMTSPWKNLPFNIDLNPTPRFNPKKQQLCGLE
jgi:hypothetical protein